MILIHVDNEAIRLNKEKAARGETDLTPPILLLGPKVGMARRAWRLTFNGTAYLKSEWPPKENQYGASVWLEAEDSVISVDADPDTFVTLPTVAFLWRGLKIWATQVKIGKRAAVWNFSCPECQVPMVMPADAEHGHEVKCLTGGCGWEVKLGEDFVAV